MPPVGIGLGVNDHGAKLEADKFLPFIPNPFLTKEDWPWRPQFDDESDQQSEAQHGGQQNQQQTEIQRAFPPSNTAGSAGFI